MLLEVKEVGGTGGRFGWAMPRPHEWVRGDGMKITKSLVAVLCAVSLWAGYAVSDYQSSQELPDYQEASYQEGYEQGMKEGRLAGYGDGYLDAKNDVSDENPVVAASKSSGILKPISKTVYVTSTGEKYHQYGCQYLRKSRIPMELTDAMSSGYTACSKCW